MHSQQAKEIRRFVRGVGYRAAKREWDRLTSEERRAARIEIRAELRRREETGEAHQLRGMEGSGSRELRKLVVEKTRQLAAGPEGVSRRALELMRRLFRIDHRGTSRKTALLEAAPPARANAMSGAEV